MSTAFLYPVFIKSLSHYHMMLYMNVLVLHEVKFFLKEINEKERSRSYKYLQLIENLGSNLRMPYSRYILPRIFELRVGGTYNIRLIYTFHNNSAIIFYGFMKKTEKISLKEMNNINNKFNDLHI